MTIFIHESAIVDDGAKIGDDTKIWHWVHISKNARIGKKCIFGQNVFVGQNVFIGNNCKVQNNVSIFDSVTIEDDVFCGPSMVFTNVLNPRSIIEKKNEFRPTLVKKGATLGANSTIICGITLGEYCFIGAGAVVTKDVEPFALMAGVPAKKIGWVNERGEKVQSHPKNKNKP
jgi:UDP-2-acetamido-3-amino-2,3-dideoxy-glucuronate N-acetyltransferase